MKVTVYPYGPDIQKHYEELVTAGVGDREASDVARSVDVEWPEGLRLPVIGDALYVGHARGNVHTVSFHLEDDEWSVVIHLISPLAP